MLGVEIQEKLQLKAALIALQKTPKGQTLWRGSRYHPIFLFPVARSILIRSLPFFLLLLFRKLPRQPNRALETGQNGVLLAMGRESFPECGKWHISRLTICVEGGFLPRLIRANALGPDDQNHGDANTARQSPIELEAG